MQSLSVEPNIVGAITPAEFRELFSERTVAAGLDYVAENRVKRVRIADDGASIEARVAGGNASPYRQTIRLLPASNGKLQISGTCTCFVGFNCKHVVAALLAYQDQAEPRAEAASPPPPAVAAAPLPYDVDTWLRSLDAAQEVESEDYPPTIRKRLLYVLDRSAYGHLPVTTTLQSIELKRDGSPGGNPRRHLAERLMRHGQQPKFLRPSDRSILRRLSAAEDPYGRDENGEELIAILQSIIATGRGRWGAWNGPILTEGPPERGDLAWTVAEDGRQRPELTIRENLLPLRLATPWYVDPVTGVMGPIQTDLPPRLIHAMLASPALPAATAIRVRDEMSRRWPASRMPAPHPIAPPEMLRHPLQPRLQLLAGELPFDPAHITTARYRPPSTADSYRTALARPAWGYGPVTVPGAAHQAPESVVQRGGVLFQVVRDLRAEQAAAERLRKLGLGRISHYHTLPDGHPHATDLVLMDPDPGAWIDFMLGDVPKLRADGWQIDIAEDFPLRLVEPSGEITFTLSDGAESEGSGIDWFDLNLGVMVDGERISLVPALLNFIATPGLADSHAASDDAALPLLLPLADGRLLAVPLAQLQPILAPLLELFTAAEIDRTGGTLRLQRRNAGDLALLEQASADSGIVWAGGEPIRTLGRQLREHGGIPPCPVPSGFGATLRAYQEHGLAWLQFLRSAGLGGVLADDMGLGKTVQALAHFAVEQAAGRLDLPVLVICPTSLVPNWRAEAARFAPALRLLVLHGPARSEAFGAIPDHDLVVTTYPLLARDHAVLTAQEWHIVVLDEAQTIKNPLAATSKLARTLRARQRLCLSGTPLENHLGELWSLFDFLSPGFLGDRQSFGRRFRAPIEKAGNTERQTLLAQRIAPFLLRRTKAEVASDLPPKTEIAETVEMGEAQRAIYEGIRLAMHARVRAAVAQRGLAGSGIVILDALLKLRQACCDPRLLRLATAKAAKAGSAKLDRLMELLPQLLEDGRRVLLFSQFTSMLALIEEELNGRRLPYVLLTGDTQDRATPIGRFQGGEVPIFLISLKAGGVGLNLTAADTVIHYDPWWNPAVEDQATDRAHRIGQDKPVFVHRLITAGTIEEKMEVLKQRKQALAAGILGASAGGALAMTESDLDMLFAPVG